MEFSPVSYAVFIQIIIAIDGGWIGAAIHKKISTLNLIFNNNKANSHAVIGFASYLRTGNKAVAIV